MFHWLIHTLSIGLWPPFLLSLCIGVPSILLYLAELFTLLKHWKAFNSSFFFLFFLRAIPHIFNFFASFLYQRFGKVGIFPGLLQSFPSPILNVLFFANFYFFHVENLANFFLLLNRLTSILFILKYGTIWRYSMPFAILATFLLPLAFTFHIFWLTVFISYDQNNSTFTLNYTYPIYYKEWPKYIRQGNVFLTMVSAVSFMAICLAINLATIFVMKRKRSQAKGETQDRQGRVERRMTIYALVTFIGQFFMAIYMIIQYIISSIVKHDDNVAETFRQEMIVAQQNQFGWVNDLCTVALPSWLLLWASTKLRQTLRREINALIDAVFPCFRSWLYQTSGGIGTRNTPAAVGRAKMPPNASLRITALPMRQLGRRLPFSGRNTLQTSSERKSICTEKFGGLTQSSNIQPIGIKIETNIKRSSSFMQPKSAWN